MRGVVIRGICQLVGSGFQTISGSKCETLGDVDFAAHSDVVGNTEFFTDGIIFGGIVVVVVIESGHSVILELVLGCYECSLFDQERSAHIELQRGGQREIVEILAVIQIRPIGEQR